MRRLGTEETSHHNPASSTRLEVGPLPLTSAEWRLQVGCWRQKPMKQQIIRHRSRQENKRVGSEVARMDFHINLPPVYHVYLHELPVNRDWEIRISPNDFHWSPDMKTQLKKSCPSYDALCDIPECHCLQIYVYTSGLTPKLTFSRWFAFWDISHLYR